MDKPRPDPDALLAAAREAEQTALRGKLKIFFGANAGVGKTYAMLEAARRRAAEGTEVVVGVVETHGRSETEQLLAGLKILPRRVFSYRGITLSEFNLEEAVRLRPALILVDELAHTNAHGSWYAKRWQDVRELLEAGIDVYTTLNVQHLESVGDLVAQLTDITVIETVPDSIFDSADDVELIDLTPDDLHQRLREGKVYIPSQAARAMDGFFTKGNLIALRELALRRMADRVELQRESFQLAHSPAEAHSLTERLLVAVSPSPFAPRVVRAGRRLAERLRASWITAYAEPPSAEGLSATDKDRVFETLRLAESLGAETVTLSGENPAEELLRFARERGVNRIVVGKPGRPRWKDRISRSFVDDLIRNDFGIDVYVVRGQVEEVVRLKESSGRPPSNLRRYPGAIAVMALCTLIAWPITHFFDETSSAMLYVLGTVVVALLFGRGPSLAASLLGVACYDFFFIPPHFTFNVSDARFLFTFLAILVVGNVIAALALQIKHQANTARTHEKRTRAMYQMTHDMTSAASREALVSVIESNMTAALGTEAIVLLPDADRRLFAPTAAEHVRFTQDWRMPVAQWVLDHGKVAGLGTDTLPSNDSLFVPLLGNQGTIGVVGLRAREPNLAEDPEQMLLLETLARHAALALEQHDLVQEATEARMQAEAERVQSTLLASVSHDLRTPLASITGAAATLADGGDALDPEARRELAATIRQEGDRLSRLVTNLLQMTRLESGMLSLNRDWQSVKELIGSSLARVETLFSDRTVRVHVEEDVPLLYVDALLIEQVLLNLLDNAAKYTPCGTPIDILARREGDEAILTIADRGPGLSPEFQQKAFEKFTRGASSGLPPGAGLGLAIVRGFVVAHGGRAAARNREGGGTEFEIRLPVTDEPELHQAEDDKMGG